MTSELAALTLNCFRRQVLWSMLNPRRADDAVARHSTPGIVSGPTVNIIGGSIIDVARDYRVFNNRSISINYSQPGW